MAATACTAAFAPLQSPWGRPLPSPAARPACQRRCLLTAHAAEQQAVPSSTAADPGISVPPPPPPPAAAATSKADSLLPERLKQLRRDGLALKDVIKMGRRGPAEGLANQVRQRWNTSEVARLYCHGKHAANMKLLTQQLEEATGGVVVHRAGGTVLLYRGDDWQQRAPAQQAVAAQRPVVATQQQAQPTEQQQQQQADPAS